MKMKRLLARIQEKSVDMAAPPVLIVALGDSVTQGWMELGRLDPEAVYHHRLQRMLEQKHPAATFSAINAGCGGEGAPGGLKRLERDVLRHGPDLLLLAYGLNDAGGGRERLPAFREAMEAIIRRTREATEADIVLLTPNMMMTADNSRVPERYRSAVPQFILTQQSGTLAAYAQSIRDTAAGLGTGLADVYAAWAAMAAAGVDTTARLANGINHPDAGMHQLAAERVLEALAG